MKLFATLRTTGFALACALLSTACRDLARFDSAGDHYEGAVVPAEFVRVGVTSDARMCLTLDTNRLEEAPGTLTTSDGRFVRSPLQTIAPVQHDALSTLSFGAGRTKNLMFSAQPAADAGASVLVIVSLMDSGGIEVRFVAPGSAVGAPPVFAVFPLEKKGGVCPFGPS